MVIEIILSILTVIKVTAKVKMSNENVKVRCRRVKIVV